MKIQIESHNIRTLMEHSFSRYGELESISLVNMKPVTYRQLKRNINKLIIDLVQNDIQEGDRVAILGENSPNWVMAYLAVTSLGAVAVPILTGFPEEDVRHIIRDAEVSAIFAAEKYRFVLEGFELPSLNVIYSLETNTCIQSRKTKRSKLKKLFHHWQNQSNKDADSTDFVDTLPVPEPDHLAVIIYTSGTTGHSKGVMLTHGNIVSNVVLSIQRFPITSDDCFLSILPLAHTFEATGGMLCPLAVGASICYMKGLPTPQKLMESMAIVTPTGVLTVPLVMDKIYRKRILPTLMKNSVTATLYKSIPGRKLLNKIAGKKMLKMFGGRLRFFMFGGASLNEDVEVFLRDAGISYSTGYGMTETSPILTINPFGHVKVGSCGQPIPGIEMRIHEPDTETGLGEIVVRGPIVMSGYIHNEEATRAVFLEGEWLRTGDLGYFDQDGYLFIKGRSKNVIVGPNGENIYPEIIEQQLITHPVIQEAVVYQVQCRLVAKVYPDYDHMEMMEKWDQADEADQKKIIQEILESARLETNERLPHFSTLQQMLEHREPFDKTPTNKVKRYLYIPD